MVSVPKQDPRNMAKSFLPCLVFELRKVVGLSRLAFKLRYGGTNQPAMRFDEDSLL